MTRAAVSHRAVYLCKGVYGLIPLCEPCIDYRRGRGWPCDRVYPLLPGSRRCGDCEDNG